jgi:hypothetical protein
MSLRLHSNPYSTSDDGLSIGLPELSSISPMTTFNSRSWGTKSEITEIGEQNAGIFCRLFHLDRTSTLVQGRLPPHHLSGPLFHKIIEQAQGYLCISNPRPRLHLFDLVRL